MGGRPTEHMCRMPRTLWRQLGGPAQNSASRRACNAPYVCCSPVHIFSLQTYKLIRHIWITKLRRPPINGAATLRGCASRGATNDWLAYVGRLLHFGGPHK